MRVPDVSFVLVRFAFFMACLLGTGPALGLEPRTAHTFQLSEGETAPDVGLEAVSWLAGNWSVSAFGQSAEEVWNPPSAGSMVGMFKLMEGDEVQFYELMTITREDNRLSFKVKHFSRDFVAWEDKPEFVNFKLVGLEDNAVHFSGISFYRHGKDRIEAYIVMRNGDQVAEEKLVMQRRTLQ